MTIPFIDTDPIVRMVTGDDPQKQQATRRLFKLIEAGQLEVTAPITVIADAVHVLTSPTLYRRPRAEIGPALAALVALPGFRVPQKGVVLRALDIYARTNLDFGDAMIVASMEAAGASILYTHDRHFDRVPGIRRIEPGQDASGANGAQPQ